MQNTFVLDYRQKIYLIKFSTPKAAQEVAYALRGFWCETMVILTESIILNNSSIPEVDHVALQLLASQMDSTYEVISFCALKLTNIMPIVSTIPIFSESKNAHLEEENKKSEFPHNFESLSLNALLKRLKIIERKIDEQKGKIEKCRHWLSLILGGVLSVCFAQQIQKATVASIILAVSYCYLLRLEMKVDDLEFNRKEMLEYLFAFLVR